MREFVVCNSLAADIRVSEGMFYNQILVKTGGMSSWVWICLRSIVFSTNWQMRDTEIQMVQVFFRNNEFSSNVSKTSMLSCLYYSLSCYVFGLIT